MFRKFYDAAPVDTPAAPPVEAPVETPSAAAQMAKSGRKLSGDEPMLQKPAAPTPPPKSEVTPPAPTPGETPKPAPPAQEPPKTEVKPDPAKPAATAEPAKPVTAPTWQEALKQQKPDAVLAELGFDAKQVKLLETLKADPKMAKFYDVWAAKGDVTAYLKAASTDYTKMAPEEVMRHSLREKYPDMSAEDFNELYAMRVTERYKLDGNEDYTAADIKRAKIELAADAKDHRDALIKAQQDYLLSAAPDQGPADLTAQILAYKEEEKQEAESEKQAYVKYMTEDSLVKDIVTNKVWKIGEGDEAFKYAVEEPAALLDLLYNTEKFAEKMFSSVPDKEGKGDLIPNTPRQLLVAAVLNDDKFLQKFAAHHQSLGANKQIAPIENASKPGETPAKAEAQPTDPAARMAKSGRIVNPGQQ